MTEEIQVPAENLEEEGAETHEEIEWEMEEAELNEGMAQSVIAKHVTINAGGAQHIEAESVDIQQGAAAQVEAETVTVSNGAIGVVKAQTVTLMQGAVGVVGAEIVSADAVQSLVLGTGDLKMNGDIRAGIMGVGDVEADSVSAFFLAAGDVHAEEVKSVFTPITAAAAGAAGGLVFALLSLLFRKHRK